MEAHDTAMKVTAFAILLAAQMLATVASATPLKPGATVAYFGLTFIDTSTEGAYSGSRQDEAARLDMLSDFVRQEFARKGFVLLDIGPVQEDIDRVVNPADCNGCDILMARKLGADYAVVGEVQKVSNLILSMNLVVRETASGNMAKGLSVDIRGNNDKSWLRGMSYILRNNTFKE